MGVNFNKEISEETQEKVLANLRKEEEKLNALINDYQILLNNNSTPDAPDSDTKDLCAEYYESIYKKQAYNSLKTNLDLEVTPP